MTSCLVGGPQLWARSLEAKPTTNATQAMAARSRRFDDRSISGVGVDTAIEMQYPMWLMPVSEFIKLTKLEPHQKLRAENRIVPWDKSMEHIFFMSHQWTSFASPNPTSEQLRAMQRIILRMMAGKLPKTSPCFTDVAYLSSTANITSKEWATMVKDVHIWLECVAKRLVMQAAPQVPFDVASCAVTSLSLRLARTLMAKRATSCVQSPPSLHTWSARHTSLRSCQR
jgi:hypothetical protein